MLCNHHHYLSPEHFHHLKKKWSMLVTPNPLLLPLPIYNLVFSSGCVSFIRQFCDCLFPELFLCLAESSQPRAISPLAVKTRPEMLLTLEHPWWSHNQAGSSLSQYCLGWETFQYRIIKVFLYVCFWKPYCFTFDNEVSSPSLTLVYMLRKWREILIFPHLCF